YELFKNEKYKEAFDCFEESILDARSCFYLGILYEKGLGVDKDLWKSRI
ncbi:556_t:CDS:1, partial [Dentiscutata heterogama]